MRALRFGLTALAVLAALGTARGEPRSAAANCNPCRVFLPAISYRATAHLLAPPDGAAIQSLAPILQWSPPVTGTYQIQVSPDPAFPPSITLPLSETKTIAKVDPIETVISTNLPPQRTFYWHVGLRAPAGYVYSPTASFTTPVKNSHLLPPGVQQIAPPNNSKALSTTVTLQWQSVPNTLFYRIRVYDSNNVVFSTREVPGSDTSLLIAGLAPGTTYHWKVKALNAYGWGAYLTTFYFSTP